MLATSLLRFPPESKSVLGMEKPPFGHLSHTHRTNPLTGMVQVMIGYLNPCD